MGKIVVTEFVSLDGVMEAPGGGEDFEHGGWTFEIERGEEGNRFKLDELDGDELPRAVARLVGDCEREPLGLDHLPVLALPVDPAALRPGEHRQPPRPTRPDVHRDAGERDLRLGAAEPVGERLRLGPLPPDALARRVEDANERLK